MRVTKMAYMVPGGKSFRFQAETEADLDAVAMLFKGFPSVSDVSSFAGKVTSLTLNFPPERSVTRY